MLLLFLFRLAFVLASLAYLVVFVVLKDTPLAKELDYHFGRSHNDRRKPILPTFPTRVAFTGAYAVGLCWTLLCLLSWYTRNIPLLCDYYGPFRWDATRAVFLLLMVLQMCRRLLECLFVHEFVGNRRASLLAVMFAWGFYPALVMCVSLEESGSLVVFSDVARACASAVVFTLASGAQFLAHKQLADLRQTDSRRLAKAGAHSYGLPRGGLFENISCPHYLAEIILYAAVAGVMGFHSLSSWVVLIFVTLNLSFSAARTQAWYRAQFRDKFPSHRRALVPFVW